MDDNDILREQGPIPARDLPKMRIDYKGLLAYAESKGVPVIELDENEKKQFVKGGGEDG